MNGPFRNKIQETEKEKLLMKIANNTICTIQKINGSYRVISGPEFGTFIITILVKFIIFVTITVITYQILDGFCRFVHHYIGLRANDVSSSTPQGKVNRGGRTL